MGQLLNSLSLPFIEKTWGSILVAMAALDVRTGVLECCSVARDGAAFRQDRGVLRMGSDVADWEWEMIHRVRNADEEDSVLGTAHGAGIPVPPTNPNPTSRRGAAGGEDRRIRGSRVLRYPRLSRQRQIDQSACPSSCIHGRFRPRTLFPSRARQSSA